MQNAQRNEANTAKWACYSNDNNMDITLRYQRTKAADEANSGTCIIPLEWGRWSVSGLS